MQCRKCKKDVPDGSRFCLFCGAKLEQESRRRIKRANGLGSVFRLPGRRKRPWAAAKDGHYIGYYDTRTAALEALNRLSGTTVSERYNYTFRDVYEHWRPEHFADLTVAGRQQYERAFDVFADLHDRKFRDLRTSDFQVILDRHADKSVSTVGKYKQLLTQMSSWAVREEIVPTNFATFCKVRGRASVGHEPLTPVEISRIEAAASTSETARIVCMLLSTGMRIGELFQLPLSDYHGDYVIGGEKSEEGRDRIIPIRQEGREHFRYFAERSEGKALLLDSYVGNHDVANFRKRDYYPLLDRLQIPRSKTPHSTRTTYGTRAVSEDVSPAVLQKVMGHADFSTTQKFYNRPDAGALVESVEKARARSAKRSSRKKKPAVSE